jgi:hypothetical protein
MFKLENNQQRLRLYEMLLHIAPALFNKKKLLVFHSRNIRVHQSMAERETGYVSLRDSVHRLDSTDAATDRCTYKRRPFTFGTGSSTQTRASWKIAVQQKSTRDGKAMQHALQ